MIRSSGEYSMTLKEAIAFLINEFCLEDRVYDARAQAVDPWPEGIPEETNSWDLPFVKRYIEAVLTLKKELE